MHAGTARVRSVAAVGVLPADAHVAPLQSMQLAAHAACARAAQLAGRPHLLATLPRLAALTALSLSHSRLDAVGASHVFSLAGLLDLRLFHCMLPSERMSDISALTALTRLSLDAVATRATSASAATETVDVAALASMTTLQRVSLALTRPAAGSMPFVLALPRLTSLRLASKFVPRAAPDAAPSQSGASANQQVRDLAALRAATALEQLNLGHSSFPGDLATIATLNLTSLNLRHFPVAASALTQLTGLRELVARSAVDVPAAALQCVAALPQLAHLELFYAGRVGPQWLRCLTVLTRLSYLTVHTGTAEQAQPGHDRPDEQSGPQAATQQAPWDAVGAAALAAAAPIQHLSLHMQGLIPSTDVLAALCAGATRLQSLYLCAVHPSVRLEPLRCLGELEQLWLHCGVRPAAMTDDAELLRPLADLPKLRDVELASFERVPRAHTRAMRGASSLRALCLGCHPSARTASNVLEHLAAAPLLDELSLSNIIAFDALHAAQLTQLTALEVLRFNFSAIDSAVCKAVGALTQLRILQLDAAVGSGFTNSAFAKLAPLTGLQQLSVVRNPYIKAADPFKLPQIERESVPEAAWAQHVRQLLPFLRRCGALRSLVDMSHLQSADFNGTSVWPNAAQVVEQLMGLQHDTIKC